MEPGGAPIPAGLKLRNRLRAVRLYLPAFAALAGTLYLGGTGGQSVLRAATLGISIVAFGKLLVGFPYPLRLVPASRFLLAMLPASGLALVVAGLGLTGGAGLVLDQVAPALALAALVAVAVELVGGRIVAHRPLRIAVLGAVDFVPAIRRELEAVGGPAEIEMIGWLNIGGPSSVDRSGAAEETLGRVRAAIGEHEIDLLVRGPGSGASRSGRDAYDAIAAGCLDLPVRMIDGNQLYERVFGHVPIGTIDSAWFLFLMHPSFQTSSKASKRAVDLVIGSLAAVITLPVIGLAAAAIKILEGGPILYRQRRVGERGREFEILKLRTMRTGSQSGDARWSSGADDERVTAVGSLLRRLHVDELPQLVNVLRGDMTLVGPRPEQPQITAELEDVFPHYSRRLLVKPGVTGWAQVRCGYAGSELGTAWKLCHDLFYLKHRSLLIDLLIMLETLVIAARDSHRPMRAPHQGFLLRPSDLEDVVGAARPGSESTIAETPLDGPYATTT